VEAAPAKTATARYDERLSAPLSWWVIAFFAGVMVGLVFLRFNPIAAAIATAASVAVCFTLVARYGAIHVSVEEAVLRAGRAEIPLSALGSAEALDSAEAQNLRSTGADPRAFMLLRSYVSTAVKVDVVDPNDPTPYLYLSTRRPEALASALKTR